MFFSILFVIACCFILFAMQNRYLKKKIICIALIGILSAIAFGCSSQTSDKEVEPPAEVEAPAEVKPEPEPQPEPEPEPEPQPQPEPEPEPEPQPEPEPEPQPEPPAPPVPQEQEIAITSERDSALREEATAFEPIEYTKDNLIYTLIGADYGTLDSHVGMSLNTEESFSNAFGIGFAKGLNEKKLASRDRKIAIYFKITPDSSVTSPRDVPEAQNIDVKITDNQGEELFELYDSVKEQTVTLEKPSYGVIVFAGYSDSEYFIIELNGKKYKIIAENINFLEDYEL